MSASLIGHLGSSAFRLSTTILLLRSPSCPTCTHFAHKQGAARRAIRTTHIGPNQPAGPNGMAEPILSELRGKKCARSCYEVRPAAILFMTTCALLAAAVEQTLGDIFPNRVRATKLDRVRLPNFDQPETP
jgi:hypothetical protein